MWFFYSSHFTSFPDNGIHFVIIMDYFPPYLSYFLSALEFFLPILGKINENKIYKY